MWLLAIRIQTRAYILQVAGYRFGFVDYDGNFGQSYTMLELGPLGAHWAPFSAAQGCIITVLIALVFIGVAAWATRRIRRAA